MAEQITALRLQQNGRRVTVQFLGKDSVTLAAVLAAPLRVGQLLEDEQIEQLRHADQVEQAYQHCLGWIARRPRSKAELDQYLRRHKSGATVLDEVIGRLADRGLINDGEFARTWVENRQAFRPRSKRALRSELRKLGVSEADAQPALAEVREAEAALAAARKKGVRIIESLDREKPARANFQKKMTAFLAMRGFDFDLSRETARQVWLEFPDSGSREGKTSESESEDEM